MLIECLFKNKSKSLAVTQNKEIKIGIKQMVNEVQYLWSLCSIQCFGSSNLRSHSHLFVCVRASATAVRPSAARLAVEEKS